jgi:N-acetyl-anhydromuramyl-L-alanine amidase AmpD
MTITTTIQAGTKRSAAQKHSSTASGNSSAPIVTIGSLARRGRTFSQEIRFHSMQYQTINPFTEEVVKTFPEHTDAQLQQIIAKADISGISEA